MLSTTFSEKLRELNYLLKKEVQTRNLDTSTRGLNEASFIISFENLVKFYEESVAEKESLKFAEFGTDLNSYSVKIAPKAELFDAKDLDMPKPKVDLIIASVYPETRLIFFVTSEQIATKFKKLGILETASNPFSNYLLKVDLRYDFDEVVKYIKSFER